MSAAIMFSEMTLKDHFAAVAMQAMISAHGADNFGPRDAYEIACEMIYAREDIADAEASAHPGPSKDDRILFALYVMEKSPDGALSAEDGCLVHELVQGAPLSQESAERLSQFVQKIKPAESEAE